MDANDIIDLLGGTAEVARLCEVRAPSVSGWRRTGIPPARLMYLRAVRPDVFGDGGPVGSTARATADKDAAGEKGCAIGAPNQTLPCNTLEMTGQ